MIDKKTCLHRIFSAPIDRSVFPINSIVQRRQSLKDLERYLMRRKSIDLDGLRGGLSAQQKPWMSLNRITVNSIIDKGLCIDIEGIYRGLVVRKHNITATGSDQGGQRLIEKTGKIMTIASFSR